MSTSLVAKFDAHPETVFEALIDAAVGMGSLISMVDAKALSLIVGKEGKSYRVAASATDNGWGKTVLHLSCTPPGSSGAAKYARRLTKATARTLVRLSPPPPPPPPPEQGPTAQ
ncbi:MAG: hypothetical protein MUP76_00815 [Acidimicrobiia bacterium]|nr:hypothetical protein [Acidimicrobiia bacterium]